MVDNRNARLYNELSYMKKAMKRRSTLVYRLTESCRLVRGARRAMGNTSRSSKPKCVKLWWRDMHRVGFAGGTDICRGIVGYLLSRKARVLRELRW